MEIIEVKKWENLNNKKIKNYKIVVEKNFIYICNDKMCLKYNLNESKFELWNILFSLGINVMIKSDMDSLLDK